MDSIDHMCLSCGEPLDDYAPCPCAWLTASAHPLPLFTRAPRRARVRVVPLAQEQAAYADGLARMLGVSRAEAVARALDEAMLARSAELRHYRLVLLIEQVGGNAALAELVGTSTRSVQRWRRGRHSPTSEERARLADIAEQRGVQPPYPSMTEDCGGTTNIGACSAPPPVGTGEEP